MNRGGVNQPHTRIKMMHDWQCGPLWWTGKSPEKLGQIEQGELPIRPELWERLQEWFDDMERTAQHPDPREWGIRDPHDAAAWERRGFDLWMELREHLGDEFHVQLLFEGEWLSPEDFPLSCKSDE